MPSALETSGDAAAQHESQTPIDQGVQPCPLLVSWIEISLATVGGAPLANERYLVVDRMGHKHKGLLDQGGAARIELLPVGSCNVSFPTIKPDAGLEGPAGEAKSDGKPYLGEPVPCPTEELHVFTVPDWALGEVVPPVQPPPKSDPHSVPGDHPPPPQDEEWEMQPLEVS